MVVFDNLDKFADVEGLLPETESDRHTLITTRNPRVEGIPARGIEILIMKDDDAIALFATLSNITISAGSTEQVLAKQIVCELGGLPLGIEVAAAYIREGEGRIEVYWEEYKTSHKNIVDKVPTGIRSYPHSIATAWSMAFKVLTENPSYLQAANLFRLLSFLNPDKILIDFLCTGCRKLKDFQSTFSNRSLLAKIFMDLESMALITWERPNRTLRIHRLTQKMFIDQMSDSERDLSINAVIALFCNSFPDSVTRDNIQDCRKYADQIVGPLLRLETVQTTEAATLMDLVAYFLRYDGNLYDAERLQRVAVSIRTEIAGVDDTDTIKSKHNLAVICSELGKHDESIKLNEEVVEKMRKLLPPEHPLLLLIIESLAMSYADQGRQEAIELEWDVFRARVTSPNATESDFFKAINGLSKLCKKLGHLEEAQTLEGYLLKQRRDTLGENHPETLASVNALTTILRDPRNVPANFGEACSRWLGLGKQAAVHEDMVNTARLVLGNSDMRTRSYKTNLAETHLTLGNFDKAENLQHEVLAETLEALGENHPATLIAKNNLASTIRRQGKFEQAATMQKEVIAMRKVILGELHPQTLGAMNNLAVTYGAQGKFEAALTLHKEVLQKRKDTLGVNHEHTWQSFKNMCFVLAEFERKSGESMLEEYISEFMPDPISE